MMKSNTQTIDYLYATTNTPPLTTHHTLIVCKAVRRMCPCDDDRDAKEDDCENVSTSDQFIWKQLHNATIVVLRRQKLLTNALDWLYLPCAERMLEARWVEGCDESLLRCTCAWWKSRQCLPFTHNGVGFHLLFHSFNATEGWDGLRLSDHKLACIHNVPAWPPSHRVHSICSSHSKYNPSGHQTRASIFSAPGTLLLLTVSP